MIKSLILVVVTFVLIAPISAQSSSKYPTQEALAKLAVDAHGGAKLKAMKSLVMRGSVDFTTSAFNQALPATFVFIIAREKYRVELANQFLPFKEVFDGANRQTTVRSGMSLPPVNRLGFPVLPMVGEPGFLVTPLPDDKKKKRGFRLTSPDGYYTDFYLDEKTNQIKGYESKYEINGRTVTTSVEVDKLRVVDGITVPEKYAQRVDTEQLTVYLDLKAKEILVNSPIDDEVFRTTN